MRLKHLFGCLFMVFVGCKASINESTEQQILLLQNDRLLNVSLFTDEPQEKKKAKKQLAKALLKMNPKFAVDKDLTKQTEIIEFTLKRIGTEEKKITIKIDVSMAKERIEIGNFQSDTLEILGSAYSSKNEKIKNEIEKNIKQLALKLFIFKYTGEGDEILLKNRTYSDSRQEIVIKPILKLSKNDKGIQAEYSDLEGDFIRKYIDKKQISLPTSDQLIPKGKNDNKFRLTKEKEIPLTLHVSGSEGYGYTWGIWGDQDKNTSVQVNSINSFSLYLATKDSNKKIQVDIDIDEEKMTHKIVGLVDQKDKILIKAESGEWYVPTLPIYDGGWFQNAKKYEVYIKNGTCVLRNTGDPKEEYTINILKYGDINYKISNRKAVDITMKKVGYDLEKFCFRGDNDLVVYTKDGKMKKCQLKHTTGFNVDDYLVATFSDA